MSCSDSRIDWERWTEIPVLTRAQANCEHLYAETVPPECGEIVSGQTSGSTGKPLPFRPNEIMAAAGSAVLERAIVWAGMPKISTVAWFLNLGEGQGQFPSGTIYRTRIRGTGCGIHELATRTPLEQRRQWLARLRPAILMGYPGALARLAANLPRELDNHSFQLVGCMGDVLGEARRATIEQGFRCPTKDVYSGSEFGIVATEDRAAARLFITEETMLVEFRPRADIAGNRERLVEIIVTPLYNYAMPLIRHSTGDLAVVDEDPAPDGRVLRRLVRTVGRQRDLFILPSGPRWWPQICASKHVARYLSTEQIQYVQTARGRIVSSRGLRSRLGMSRSYLPSCTRRCPNRLNSQSGKSRQSPATRPASSSTTFAKSKRGRDRNLLPAREMVLDREARMIAERLGLHVEVDVVAEALAGFRGAGDPPPNITDVRQRTGIQGGDRRACAVH